MILDEKEIDQRFLIDLLRMEGKDDLQAKIQVKPSESLENLEEIMMELELSDPEINEEANFPMDNFDAPDSFPEPMVAITRHHLSDSRKNWKINKIIIGTRRCYCA